MNNAKKQRKTIEWTGLKISSRKLEILREHCAEMGKIKHRNGRDLTDAEDIKMWQAYTAKLYKKVLMTWATMMV